MSKINPIGCDIIVNYLVYLINIHLKLNTFHLGCQLDMFKQELMNIFSCKKTNKMYQSHFKYRAPEINLPFSRTNLIFSFFKIDGEPNDPRKTASCNICEKEFNIIFGKHINSCYTYGLTFHLQNHPSDWSEYLNNLAKKMAPDNKTKYEHYKEMTSHGILPKDVSNERFDECNLTWAMNESFRNLAGVPYSFRDRVFIQNSMHKIAEGQNARMFEYLFKFSNKNLTLYDLMGTKHPNANLMENYKKSKCLVDNIENLTADLQKLFCDNICFHDPELFDHCPNNHTGDIAIFADKAYQQSFPNLEDELEKYPEFLSHTSFNHQILKSVPLVEHDQVAVVEMNRLLKILISMITVQRRQFRMKTDQIKLGSTDENHLVKPPLAINFWGPKYSDIDIPDELDSGKAYPDEMFSTFRHVNREDCPARKDKAMDINHEPVLVDGKVKYPCNVGGCGKNCECDPCAGKGPLICQEHHPDHPLLFDPEEDFFISRRIFVDPKSNETIWKRPLADPRLSPPDLLLTGLKLICKTCKHNVNNHVKHHYSLHPTVCDICNHMGFISNNSFHLICYICMKKFESKYRLKDHMNIHSEEANPHFCKVCEIGFVTKFTYERHILENHEVKKEDFSCTECSASFTFKRNLQRHTDEHHNMQENPEHKCDLCEKSYKRKDTLLKHKRIEHNKDERKVNIPGVNDNMNSHQCYLCSKMFKQKFTLDRHQETMHFQNSNVLFECKTCDKSFRRRDKLLCHEKTHILGVPRIVCEICLKEFKSKDGLKAHRISNHEEN